MTDLAQRANEIEALIIKAVADGATTLREVWVVVPHEIVTRYAFYRALNEGRLVMGSDRKLRLP